MIFTRHLRSYQPSVITSVPWWTYIAVALVAVVMVSI